MFFGDGYDGICCGLCPLGPCPAMHADGTTSTTLTVTAPVWERAGEGTADGAFASPNWENSGAGSNCSKCATQPGSWTLPLVAVYNFDGGASERYIFSTVPMISAYPLWVRTPPAAGDTSCVFFDESNTPCSFRTPTLAEMAYGAPWLVELDPDLAANGSVQVDSSADVKGCYGAGSVVCNDLDDVTFDYIGGVGSASTIVPNKYPKKRCAVSVVIDIEQPSGGGGTPSGGAVRIRWIAHTWALRTFRTNGGVGEAVIVINNTSVYTGGSEDCFIGDDAFRIECVGAGYCSGLASNYEPLVGDVVTLGQSLAREWHATTGDDSLPTTAWEWDATAGRYRIAKDFAPSILSVPLEVGTDVPDIDNTTGEDSNYTETPGDRSGCDLEDAGMSEPQWNWMGDGEAQGITAATGGGDPVAPYWAVPFWYAQQHGDSGMLGGYVHSYNCFAKTVSIALGDAL